jgi:hypothetical protein
MPVNYQMDVVNPFQAALQGYGAGAQLLQQQQAAQQQQVEQGQKSQLFGLQMQEAQGRLAALQAERDKAARAQEASAAVYDMLGKPDWFKTTTAGDIARAMEGNPELGKFLTTEMTRLNDEQKLNGFNQNWSVASALERDNPAQAEALLEDQAAAFENSGDPQKAATLRGMKDQLKTPEGRDILKKTMLVNASVLDPDRFDKLRTGLIAEVKLPQEMELGQAQINAARAAANRDRYVVEAEKKTGSTVQSSVPFRNGAILLSMKDGSTIVRNPQQQIVTGADAERTLVEANNFESKYKGINAGEARAAQIGQDIAKDAFISLGKVRSNMLNLDQVEQALLSGADVGLAQSQLPATNAATLELRQMRNLLGLDVVGSTTFGALSKGELDLALDIGLPTNMERKDLLNWVRKKKAAQEKLANYFTEQAQFLSIPNMKVGDWLDHLEEIKKQNSPQGGSAKPAIASVKVIP